MAGGASRARIVLTGGLVVGITFALYLNELHERHYLIIYQGLYFIPLILSGFWFGLRGALTTSLVITLFYTPYTIMHWNGFSADDLSNVVEMVLYNAVGAIMGILRDREQAEQKRFLEAENLAAIGRAMSCVAHDMKTPLVAIGGFSLLIRKHLTEDDPHREKLDIIINEAYRLENMVKDLLDFSRPLQLDRSEEDVKQLIGECIAVVTEVARKKEVTVEARPSPDLPQLPVDPMRMKRLLINLVMNAVQASPEGESVTIDSYRSGNSVTIDVIDRGCGIPREKRKEIFSPFFSTKKEGTGLGLPIAKKIVEAHQGHLEVLDNPETGLTFRVHIPIAPK